MLPYKDLTKAIHKEGYIFIVIAIVASFLIGSLSTNLAWICVIITAWCVYFFRNPERVTPKGDDLVVSAADGIITSVGKIKPPSEMKGCNKEMIRVSVFLSVFNVHVNRIPASGKVISLKYHPGKFLNASLDKASVDNERQSVVMETKSGKKIAFVQIAGLIARRIVCELEEGDKIEAGKPYGIIRFGSRVDIYLPVTADVLVSKGQTCIGGETVIADLKGQAKSKKREFVIS